MTDRERYLEALRECGRLAAEIQRAEVELREARAGAPPAFHRGLERIYEALCIGPTGGSFDGAVKRANALWELVACMIGPDGEDGEPALDDARLVLMELYAKLGLDHEAAILDAIEVVERLQRAIDGVRSERDDAEAIIEMISRALGRGDASEEWILEEIRRLQRTSVEHIRREGDR